MTCILRFISIVTCLAIISCSSQTGQTDFPVVGPDKASYRSTGVIKKIDLETSMVTIDHEDIPGYMPPMEMTEKVIEVNMLKAFRVGDVVEFDLERTGSDLLITNIAKMGVNENVMGAEIFRVNCSECHGAKGEGAEKGIPLISGHALHHSEDDFRKTVSSGKNLHKEKHMPAFGDTLGHDEIAAVVKYIRGTLQSEVPKEEAPKHKH